MKRLHRIEGQVRGIERMVEDDRYCIDILTQISAVTTALESLALQLLDEHVKHCVAGALASGDEAEIETKTAELLAAVQRFTKSRRSADRPVHLEHLRVLAVDVDPVRPREAPDVLGIGVPAVLLRGVAGERRGLALEVAALQSDTYAW